MKAGALVVFDGVCNLCNGAVRFVIAHDPCGYFRFAPLQSQAAQTGLAPFGLQAGELQGIVLVENGRAYAGSDAVLRIAASLCWPWTLGRFLLAVPRAPREACYALVARNRYRWFGRRDVCSVPRGDVADRFSA